MQQKLMLPLAPHWSASLHFEKEITVTTFKKITVLL